MKKVNLLLMAVVAMFALACSGNKEVAPRDISEDITIIEKYLTDNGLTADKTASNLYYIMTEEGDGDQAEAGKNVSVHYKGYLTDGEVFDSSIDRGQPIEFELGAGKVIPGWDEGIALFKKGGKGTLLIPSQLAYGNKSAGKIEPNSVLLFDIELVDVK